MSKMARFDFMVMALLARLGSWLRAGKGKPGRHRALGMSTAQFNRARWAGR